LADYIARIEFASDERRRLDDHRIGMVVVVPIVAAGRKDKNAKHHD
jgi:hypothetical protein